MQIIAYENSEPTNNCFLKKQLYYKDYKKCFGKKTTNQPLKAK